MSDPLFLNTERVTLRRLRAEDAAAYQKLESDPDVKRYLGGVVNRTVEETLRKIESLRDGWVLLAIIDKKSGCFIGRCGLIRGSGQTPEAELHLALAKNYWGGGLATEIARALISHGFGVLGFKVIIGVVHPNHTASIRVLEKLGMEHVGFFHSEFPGDWKQGFLEYRAERRG